MLTLQQVKALRITNEVVESLHEFNNLNVSVCKVHLNSYFENFKAIEYALKILGIPYEVYSGARKLSENNLVVGIGIEPKLIYYLVFLVNKLIEDTQLYVYLSYASDTNEKPFQAILGSYIVPRMKYFNVSRRIPSDEILSLSINSLTTSSLCSLYPNSNYHSSNACMSHVDEDADDDYFMSRNSDDEDDTDSEDSWEGNSSNEYYDDNLDMDQQSQEYWDNL